MNANEELEKFTHKISDHFDATDSYKLKIDGVKDELANVAKKYNKGLIIPLSPNRNLLDLTDETHLHSMLDGSGGVTYNIIYTSVVSDYIEVEGGETYCSNSDYYSPIDEYDEDYVFIKHTSTFYRSSPITLAANTKYIRINFDPADANLIVQFEKGVYSTELETIKKIIPPSQLFHSVLHSEIRTPDIITKKAGKNIFDKDINALEHCYLTTGGDIIYNAGYIQFVTDYFAIEPSTEYCMNHAYWNPIAEYDADYNFIKYTHDFNDGHNITTDANTRFARLETEADRFDVIQIEAGSSKTAYEAFVKTIQEIDLGKAVLKSELDPSKAIILTPGKNIWPPDLTEYTNKYIDPTTGVLLDSGGGQSAYDYVEVEGGETYVHDNVFTTNLGEYDASNNFVAYTASWNSPAPHTMNASTKYIRIELSPDSPITQLEKNTAPTFYEAYLLSINEPLNSEAVLNAIPFGTNDIQMPVRNYFLKDYENTIYHKCIMRRWQENLFFSRMTNLINRTSHSRLTPLTTGDVSSDLTLLDSDFVTQKTISTTIKVGDVATDTGAINFIQIGDSFSYVGVFQKRAKDLCPNLNMLGLLYWPAQTTYHEGRSGWTLNNFFTNLYDPVNHVQFSPFMQPIDPYKYYGSTQIVLNALADYGEATMLHTYVTAKGFNAGTGLLSSPSTNDVMYQDSAAGYKVWDGSAWVDITVGTLNFSFNFGKYRSVFGISAPDYVGVFLGMNDFSGSDWHSVAAGFVSFKANMDALIASVLADTATAKVVVMLPSGWVGDNNSLAGNNNLAQHAALWEARKLMIAEYDDREAENIYLLDMGSALDAEYGFVFATAELPFEEYVEDAKTVQYTQGNPHPSTSGYNQLGTRLAAFIQVTR